ncbi:MAG: hypothetical protein WDM91_11015 [Rhizomicrobium sp.]
MIRPQPTLFTAEDAQRAHDEWGANCGPGALAAIMHMTLDQVRPHMLGFDGKRYTNPTMMSDALRSIGRPWRKIGAQWPDYGLVRIQWEGPWTLPGVPLRARYRFTHWVGAARHGATIPDDVGVFDINCIANGSGWTAFRYWHGNLVPWLLNECVPRASGGWHITHAIEVEVPR